MSHKSSLMILVYNPSVLLSRWGTTSRCKNGYPKITYRQTHRILIGNHMYKITKRKFMKKEYEVLRTTERDLHEMYRFLNEMLYFAE